MTDEEKRYVLEVLTQTRAIVSRGANHGFNPIPSDGDEWCTHLYVNNGALGNAIKILEKEMS